jgi:hypothetical protein
MEKMKIHSELEDTQISKLNKCFLVVDRIRKAGRSSRQGFGKFKSKLNPNGGGVRTSVVSSSGISLFANGPLFWSLRQCRALSKLLSRKTSSSQELRSARRGRRRSEHRRIRPHPEIRKDVKLQFEPP